MSTTKATLEYWGLRLRNLASTVVQLAGFLLIFVGIYRFFAVPLAAAGIDLSFVEPFVSRVPTVGGSGLALLVAGLVVVWLSTSPRTK